MRCFEVLAVNSLVLLSACGYATDDLPTISDDWIITLESASRVGEAEFPLSVEVTFGVEGLGPTNSGPPPDATNLSLTTVFSETEVEQTVQTPIYDGVAQVTVVFEEPGGADCTAGVGDSYLVFRLEVTETGEVQISG